MDDVNTHVRDVLIEVVSRISRVDYSGIGDDVLIREELGIDSLMAIEMLAKIEKHFNIDIDESILAEVETVGDFVDMLKEIIRQARS